jgi:hypothetical protein
MATLYADEDFSYRVVEELRRLGHDVLTAHEAGKANQRIPDPNVLAFATHNSRVLLTFNRKHFIRLSRAVSTHSGIVVCTRDDDVVALAERIHTELAASPDMSNKLIRVNRPG